MREDRQSLVQSPFTTSSQETERVYSYNPGACTGLTSFNTYHTINTQQRRTYTHARRIKERVNQGRWKTYDWKMQTADSR